MPIGKYVSIKVKREGHKHHHMNGHKGEMKVTRKTKGIDFKDATTHSLKLSMAGGHCKKRMGTMEFKVQGWTCAGFSRTLKTNADTTSVLAKLPAMEYSVDAMKVDAVPSGISAAGALNFFQTSYGTLRVSLQQKSQSREWLYHPSPTLKLLRLGREDSRQCKPPQIVLKAGKLYRGKLLVSQKFGTEVCNNVTGEMKVVDGVTGKGREKQFPCSADEGCTSHLAYNGNK